MTLQKFFLQFLFIWHYLVVHYEYDNTNVPTITYHYDYKYKYRRGVSDFFFFAGKGESNHFGSPIIHSLTAQRSCLVELSPGSLSLSQCFLY